MNRSCSSRSLPLSRCAELAQGSLCWDQAGSRVGAVAGGQRQAAGSGSEECSVISAVARCRSLRAVCVLNETAKPHSTEWGALQCLERACRGQGAHLLTLPFGKLDFGETPVLDFFYNADIAVVDMSDVFRQPTLFYHLGVRESFGMTNNVILYHNTDLETAQSLKAASGNYHFIPYVTTTNDDFLCCENDFQRRVSEFLQPSWDSLLGPFCQPLLDKLISLLKDIDVTSCTFAKDTLLSDIRKLREKYQGEDLAKQLSGIKQRIECTEVVTPDIITNLLFSYRDIQDYDGMVKLVETLEMLPTCDLANQHNIKFHYAFALNRKSISGVSLPSSLTTPGPVLLWRHMRSHKTDPLVERVQLLHANPQYAYIAHQDGRHDMVSLRDLAPAGSPANTPHFPLPTVTPCASYAPLGLLS